MRSISIHKIALVGLAAILLIPLAFGETPVDTSKNLDFSALNFVLQDLLTYSGDDSPVLIKDSPPNSPPMLPPGRRLLMPCYTDKKKSLGLALLRRSRFLCRKRHPIS